MLPVAGVPVTVHQITRARDAGVTRIVLGTSYKADVFKEFIDASDLGIEVVIATEDEPLGTGGAIRHVLPYLESGADEPVLVFNGDILSGLDIAGLVRTHQETQSDVSLYLTTVEDPRAFGLVPTDANGRVIQFLEKPQTPEELVTDQINAGCYVFKRSVIDSIPTGRPVSVERETFPGYSSRAPLSAASSIAGTGLTSELRWPSCRVRAIWCSAMRQAPLSRRPGSHSCLMVQRLPAMRCSPAVRPSERTRASPPVRISMVLWSSTLLRWARMPASRTRSLAKALSSVPIA